MLGAFCIMAISATNIRAQVDRYGIEYYISKADDYVGKEVTIKVNDVVPSKGLTSMPGYKNFQIYSVVGSISGYVPKDRVDGFMQRYKNADSVSSTYHPVNGTVFTPKLLTGKLMNSEKSLYLLIEGF